MVLVFTISQFSYAIFTKLNTFLVLFLKPALNGVSFNDVALKALTEKGSRFLKFALKGGIISQTFENSNKVFSTLVND